MHIIIGMFASHNRCPTCGKRLIKGECSRCNAKTRAVKQVASTLAAELQAAQLLQQFCGLYCQRTGAGTWRVDRTGAGTMRTAIMHGTTLLVMAEKRLPPEIWSRGTT